MTEFQLSARFEDDTMSFLFKEIGLIVIDDDFFDYLEDKTEYEGGVMDIELFAFHYMAWEKDLR